MKCVLKHFLLRINDIILKTIERFSIKLDVQLDITKIIIVYFIMKTTTAMTAPLISQLLLNLIK